MDEKKTYLVNVESNLKEYADLAAEAKKKVDELTVANIKLQASDQATAAEKEAGLAALKNANDEYRKAASLVKTQIAANTSEIGSRKQLGETLKLQMQALGKLGNAYITNAKGQRELNPLYIEQRKQIAATKQAILDYDKSLNDGRSNVGRYGESIKSAFGDVKKNLLGMLAPAALITAGIAGLVKIMNGLKAAFADTEAGAKFFNQLSARWKTFAQGLTRGEWNPLYGDTGDAAAKAADKLNQIRIDDRKDLVAIKQMETDIKLLRLQSVDTTKDLNEQMKFLLLADEKENELMDYKIKDKEEELIAVRENLAFRKTDIDLLNRQAQLEAEIIETRGDKSLRIASKIASTQEKIDSEEAKRKDDAAKAAEKAFNKAQALILKNQAALQKEVDDYKKAQEEKLKAEIKYQEGIEQIRADFQEQKKARELTNQENEILIREANTNWLYDAERTRLEIQYNQEIANAEKTGAAISLINEKYAAIRSQIDRDEAEAKLMVYSDFAGSVAEIFGRETAIGKAAAIAQATISTYVAANKALATYPPPFSYIAMGAAILAGIANVVKIVQVKSGLPGERSVSAPTSIVTSVPAMRTFATNTGSTIFTQPQLSQSQLNTLPNQNSLSATDIARALSNMPAPVVTVEDINARVNQVNKVTVRGNI